MENKIKITELPGDRFLLEGEDNSLLGLRVSDSAARILFTDYNSSLIRAAEAKAASLGKKSITSNFADRYRELTGLFKKNGYTVKESLSIISVDLAKIQASKEVRKSMTMTYEGTEWIPFRDLLEYQFEELESLFRVEGIIISREELMRFDPDLSGIVYDEKKKICAFILVSTQGEEILIECLHGVRKETPRYVMAALKGFATEICNCDMEDIYRKISMIELNPKIRDLVRRLLDDKDDISDGCRVIHAHKTLSAGGDLSLLKEGEQNSASVFAAITKMEDRLARQRYQNNINWKSRWNIQ